MSAGLLAVLGDLVEDIVVWLSGPLRPATDNPAVIHRRRGGSAANVAAFAAPYVPTRFLGRVGADPLGDSLIGQLAEAGVDVRVRRGGTTGGIVILVDEYGERTMLPDRGAAADLADIPAEWLDGVTALHVPTYPLIAEPGATCTLAVLRTTIRRAATVTMDASSTAMLQRYGPDRYLDLVAELRPAVLFANAEEAALLGLVDVPVPSGTRFVITDGPRPTTVIDERGERSVVAVPPAGAVRDTTGAGDAFAAGYLAAMLSGASTVDSVGAGHRLAAAVVGAPGASTSGPSRIMEP